MKLRRFILPTAVAAAVGGPYFYEEATRILDQTQSTVRSWTTSSKPDGSSAEAPSGTPSAAGEAGDGQPTRHQALSDVPLEGVPVYDLGEVLRMDVTQAWVYSRWSRKSTALADLNLFGIRVPLVTGTGVDDLAGSLTYYFNPEGRVQRISFRGRTGDARKLVSLMVARYGLRLQTPEIPGEQLYQVRWNAKPISELRIRPAPVIWASAPHASFLVELELERPGSGRFVERRAA
jgi:hypothetical protein